MTSIHNINTKFITTVDKLLFLTQTKIHDQELISNNLSDLNELDYRHLKISNNQVNQLNKQVLINVSNAYFFRL